MPMINFPKQKIIVAGAGNAGTGVLFWSFLGLGMTTYTAWYFTIATAVHGQVGDMTRTPPTKLMMYFTRATNILYISGGHAVTVEIMHALWKPQKFKYIYSNAFSLLPKNVWRDATVILMLIHQFISFGFACTPLYFVWEKVIGMHDTKSICLRALARLPVMMPIWFLALIFPFFTPIIYSVGALLVSFAIYIIPSLAYMLTYRKTFARQNAAEKPPFFLRSWTAMWTHLGNLPSGISVSLQNHHQQTPHASPTLTSTYDQGSGYFNNYY